jgi:hypothetical protein
MAFANKNLAYGLKRRVEWLGREEKKRDDGIAGAAPVVLVG